MGLKPDRWIRQMSLEHRMIDPFADRQVRTGVVSYGVSSYGYDFRVADEFKICQPGDAPTDPKKADPAAFQEVRGAAATIPPGTFALARTVEYFRIPRDVLTICFGKSTYARCGVVVNVTPFEPGWEGHATISIANTGPRPVVIHANEGIAQLLFFQGDEPCEISYADKQGKYQASTGITQAKL